MLRSSHDQKNVRQVLILTGPGGSGKTTIADLLVAKRGFIKVDGDSLDGEFFPDGGQWLPENVEKLRLAHQKILFEVKRLFNEGKNVVLDYIIFGDYLNFFKLFENEFGDALRIKVLFPDKEETVKRDSERACWTTGIKRILAVQDEFTAIKNRLGKDKFIDTTHQTPDETFEEYFKVTVHTMKLVDTNFKGIESGVKTFEIRLLDEKRQAVKVGDRIVFVRAEDPSLKIEVNVINLVVVPSFLELFNKIDVVQAGWPIGTTPEQAVQDMAAYYPPDEQAEQQVVAIEIEKI